MSFQAGIVVAALATVAISVPVVRSAMIDAVPDTDRERSCRRIVCDAGGPRRDGPDLRLWTH